LIFLPTIGVNPRKAISVHASCCFWDRAELDDLSGELPDGDRSGRHQVRVPVIVRHQVFDFDMRRRQISNAAF
jgi:hypothetical protein